MTNGPFGGAAMRTVHAGRTGLFAVLAAFLTMLIAVTQPAPAQDSANSMPGFDHVPVGGIQL
ncbi:MAG: hypothetical protein KDE06_05580, partial [Rhodobacteraceae bacterium]|nr:hypothetical protein [Paracoccaceae bacterium]